MISILDLKKFMVKKQWLSLSLILQNFTAKQEEILAILELLIQKGYVKKCVKTPNCATRCLSCTAESFVFYQWVEPA